MFIEQRVTGTLRIWAEPLVTLRFPKLFNLRTDPYERADVTSNTYYDWIFDHLYLFVPAQEGVAEFLKTFKEFPPRQKAASFNLDQVMADDRDGGRWRLAVRRRSAARRAWLPLTSLPIADVIARPRW